MCVDCAASKWVDKTFLGIVINALWKYEFRTTSGDLTGTKSDSPFNLAERNSDGRKIQTLLYNIWFKRMKIAWSGAHFYTSESLNKFSNPNLPLGITVIHSPEIQYVIIMMMTSSRNILTHNLSNVKIFWFNNTQYFILVPRHE